MIDRLLRILMDFLLMFFVQKAKEQVEVQIKARTLRVYLKTLQSVRFTFIGVLALLFFVQIVTLGLFLLVGAGLYLAPLAEEHKAWIALALGIFFFLLPLIGVVVGLSERTWYRASGAEKMANDVLDKAG